MKKWKSLNNFGEVEVKNGLFSLQQIDVPVNFFHQIEQVSMGAELDNLGDIFFGFESFHVLDDGGVRKFA